MPFEKGQSGNPGGRPKQSVAVRDLAREHTEEAIQALVAALNDKNGGVRVSAAQALLDRGWGKATQVISGDKDAPLLLQVTRTVIGSKEPETIEGEVVTEPFRVVHGGANRAGADEPCN